MYSGAPRHPVRRHRPLSSLERDRFAREAVETLPRPVG
jgi:hypothetical protein